MIILRKDKSNGAFNDFKEVPFDKEKSLHLFFENHLETIANLKLICSEFSIENWRLDTLAFDEETKSFVIIEYKKEKHSSVFDQGMAYLSIVLSNMAELVLKYNETQEENITKNDVNWAQTRVIIVNNAFTPKQIKSCNFVNMPVTLMELKKYGDDTIVINVIEKAGNSPTLVFPVKSTKDKLLATQSENYTEERVTKVFSSDKIKNLYEEFRDSCLDFEVPLKLVPLKHYIAFKTERNRNAFTIVCNKSTFTIYFFMNENSNDYLKGQIEPAEKGHWGTGDMMIKVNDKTNINLIVAFFETMVKEK